MVVFRFVAGGKNCRSGEAFVGVNATAEPAEIGVAGEHVRAIDVGDAQRDGVARREDFPEPRPITRHVSRGRVRGHDAAQLAVMTIVIAAPFADPCPSDAVGGCRPAGEAFPIAVKSTAGTQQQHRYPPNTASHGRRLAGRENFAQGRLKVGVLEFEAAL